MPDINIQQWDEATFLNSREQWNNLLERSAADRLFLSWEWLASWWQTFADSSMQLKVFAATDSDGKLLGLAPLYLSRVKSHSVSSNRLQFIGNCWREHSTMPTELLDFIVDKCSGDILPALLLYIDRLSDWDELVIPYISRQSKSFSLIENKVFFKLCLVRDAEQHQSFYLPLHSGFDDYLKSLSKSVRLKLYNRRSRLAQSGAVAFSNHINNNIEENFSLLNRLHEQRWGKAVFTGQRLKFNQMLAERLAERNALDFSVLTLNNRPVSIQYNYIVDGHVYNIQAGFEVLPDKKIALGYLHFGYEIESAYKQKYSCYDFLAGEGKNTQYKAGLTESYIDCVDIQIVRKPLLKILYRLHAVFRR